MKNIKKAIISIDVGGTFCDCFLERDGYTRSLKLLSTGRLRALVTSRINTNEAMVRQNWGLPHPGVLKLATCLKISTGQTGQVRSFDPLSNGLVLEEDLDLKKGEIIEIYTDGEVPIFAAHLLTGIPLNKDLRDIELRVGTTKGTNALLEMRGRSCVWITNKGFKDLLYIKTQQRPHLFQLNIAEPKNYHHQVIEVEARINAQGNIIRALGEQDIEKVLTQIPTDPDIPIAVSLLHAYRNPKHELQIKKILLDRGFRYVSVSHELHPAIHLLPRSETTVANAYLSPIIQSFIDRISYQLPPDKLYFISSAGQLIPAALFHPKDSLLSGPAGGIKAAEYLSQQYGIHQLITFDMGGTSTDTARIDHKADVRFNTQIGELNLASPGYHIESVAAGGGSLVDFVDGRFTVGPLSAGADPGPACYGRNGPFTLTDVNLMLGKLQPAAFSIPINSQAAEKRFIELLKKAGLSNNPSNRNKILEGIETIANEIMAEAIRKISFSKGFDPSGYSLLVFGGAGGLHACAIAERLKMGRIIIPFNAGIFSAQGISNTSQAVIKFKQINELFENSESKLIQWFANLDFQARRELKRSGLNRKNIEVESRQIFMRYKGQDQVIGIDWSPATDLLSQFVKKYRQIYHTDFNFPIEIERILIKVKTKSPGINAVMIPTNKRVYTQNTNSKFFNWTSLHSNQFIQGPCTVYHDQATCFIQNGWGLQVMNNKDLILTPTQKNNAPKVFISAVELELFNNRFKSIAEQMGAQLKFSAFSVNVKERLDFSCALLDDRARLLVNAPHIPVHLGSLGLAARLILEEYTLDEGDIILSNHPKYGGSHLPDLTLLKAVFDDDEKLIGYVINRAHHAEIGGMTPGSMPAFAVNLEQEGVIFRPAYIYKKGKPQWKSISNRLTKAIYPSRNPELNVLDLKAGISALLTGEKQLKLLARTFGTSNLHKQMKKIFRQSHQLIDDFIQKHKDKIYSAVERMDDGKMIKLKVSRKKDQLVFDFTGTSSPHPGNLNANPSIVQSVLLYTLRLLCNKDIPLNEGLMKKVKIINPKSFIHPDFQENDRLNPAVVGGNTEVSQRLTDTLIKAFHLAACSQGTMNNLLFGNDRYSYYETIGGGVGAGPGFDGRSAIHQHMTNTKITDPEELELRYPVLLKEFSVREGSGGKGKFIGGNGITRVIQFLEGMTVTILAQHRKEAPYGMKGGLSGSTGNQVLIQKNLARSISANESFSVMSGDELRIETPGGGGWGKAKVETE